MKFLARLLLATLLLAASLHTLRGDPPEHPNLLFILCDDIRWDHLGCAGHPYLKTPNIDRLANEGVHFRNMFCTTSLCSPSRGCRRLISGGVLLKRGAIPGMRSLPSLGWSTSCQ